MTLIASCNPDNEEFTSDPNALLRFSTDSVKFDTVFSSVPSISKRFLVYNDNSKAVNISEISLRLGNNSNYDLIINGQQTPSLTNQRLLGKDSLQIIVSVTIDPINSDLPYLSNDFVDFNTNGNLQSVYLVAWGQDAIFLSKGTIDCNTTWTAKRPYVLKDTILVAENCQWNIEKGVKIYAQPNAAIIIAGSVNAKGTADERILITNERQDKNYINAPGQWGGILFAETSHDNRISFTDIRNAVNGIYLGTPDEDEIPDLILDHSKIENMSGVGIISFTSDLYAYNTLINNCGVHLAGHFAGGNYRYEHCTFVNLDFDFYYREDPSIIFSDFADFGEEQFADNISVSLVNSIIWGELDDEIILSNAGGKIFEINTQNNLIKTTDEGYAVSNLINEDPIFINPYDYDYQLDELSPAKDNGIDIGIVTDLEGNLRDANPDIGAYEGVE